MVDYPYKSAVSQGQVPPQAPDSAAASTIKLKQSPPAPDPSATVPPSSSSSISAPTVRRGVRNLNPEQLAKKRQNDRDAQRAIRERTKTQIESLEKRVKELESGQAYQELQNVITEKEALRQENESIKGRLSSVIGLIKPVIEGHESHGAMNHVTQSDQRQSKQQFVPPEIKASPDHSNDFRSPAGEQTSGPYRFANEHSSHSPRSSSTHDHDTPHDAPSSPAVSTSAQGRNHQWRDMHGEEGSQPYPRQDPSQQQHQYRSHNTSAASSPHPINYSPDPTHQSLSRGGQKRPLSSLSHSSGPHSTHYPSPQAVTSPRAAPPPAWTQLPRNLPPKVPLDYIFDDFISEARARISEGLPVEDLLPSHVDFTPLVYSDQSMADGSVSLSQLLADIMKGFSDVKGWPEKIGKVITIFYWLRWYICPTQEHYEMMPYYMKPVEEQVRHPHPIWMDMVPWPQMRARLVLIRPSLPLEAFFPEYAKTLDLSWPWGADATECLQPAPGTISTISRHYANRARAAAVAGNSPAAVPGAGVASAVTGAAAAGAGPGACSPMPHRSLSADPSDAQKRQPQAQQQQQQQREHTHRHRRQQYGDPHTSDAAHRPGEEELRVTPNYWAHINVLENWSLGASFGEAIPALAGTYRVKERE